MAYDMYEEFCETIDYIVTKKVDTVQFNTTETGTIIEVLDNAQYKVTIGNNNSYAIAFALGSDTYKVQDSVIVLIPNNDWTAEKIILRKAELNLEEKVSSQISLSDVDLVRNIFTQSNEIDLSNDIIRSDNIEINHKDYSNNIYDYLGVRLNINTSSPWNGSNTAEIIDGDYGVRLNCVFENKHWELQRIFKEFLDSAKVYCTLYRDFIPYDTSFETDEESPTQITSFTSKENIIEELKKKIVQEIESDELLKQLETTNPDIDSIIDLMIDIFTEKKNQQSLSTMNDYVSDTIDNKIFVQSLDELRTLKKQLEILESPDLDKIALNITQTNQERLTNSYLDTICKLCALLNGFQLKKWNNNIVERLLYSTASMPKAIKNWFFKSNGIFDCALNINNQSDFLTTIETINDVAEQLLSNSNNKDLLDREIITASMVNNQVFIGTKDEIFNPDKVYYTKESNYYVRLPKNIVSFDEIDELAQKYNPQDGEDLREKLELSYKLLSACGVPHPQCYYDEKKNKRIPLYELSEVYLPARSVENNFNENIDYYIPQKSKILSQNFSFDQWKLLQKLKSYTPLVDLNVYYKKVQYRHPSTVLAKDNYYIEKLVYQNFIETNSNELIKSMVTDIENGNYIYYAIDSNNYSAIIDINKQDYCYKELQYLQTNDSISTIKTNVEKEKENKTYYKYSNNQYVKIGKDYKFADTDTNDLFFEKIDGLYFITVDTVIDFNKEYYIRDKNNNYKFIELFGKDDSEEKKKETLEAIGLFANGNKVVISTSGVEVYEKEPFYYLIDSDNDKNSSYLLLNKVKYINDYYSEKMEVKDIEDLGPKITDEHTLYILYKIRDEEKIYTRVVFRKPTGEIQIIQENFNDFYTISSKRYISLSSYFSERGNLIKTIKNSLAKQAQVILDNFFIIDNNYYEPISNYKDLVANKVYTSTYKYEKVMYPYAEEFNAGKYYVLDPLKRLERNNSYLLYKFLTSTFINNDNTVNIDQMKLFLQFITSDYPFARGGSLFYCLGEQKELKEGEVIYGKPLKVSATEFFGDPYNFIDGQYQQEYLFPIQSYGQLKNLEVIPYMDKESFQEKVWESSSNNSNISFDAKLSNIEIFLCNDKEEEDSNQIENLYNKYINFEKKEQ